MNQRVARYERTALFIEGPLDFFFVVAFTTAISELSRLTSVVCAGASAPSRSSGGRS